MTHIETDRLIIRPFEETDATDLHEILGDEEAMRNLEPAYDINKTMAFLQNFCIARGSALAAELKDRQKVIGYLLFNEYEPGVYEAGWVFNRLFWRRGYAFEALYALFGHAFEQMSVRKIFAETIDVTKTVPLMEKLGMICKDKTDMYCYELSAENWRK